MNNWFLIPLTNTPQSFQITLSGVNYTLTVKWNDADDAGWQFDLDNADTDTNLVAGSPFVTGANCLAGLDYLGVGGSFLIFTSGDATAVPTYDNLGDTSNLYYVTENAN